jgi:hypothetical protein
VTRRNFQTEPGDYTLSDFGDAQKIGKRKEIPVASQGDEDCRTRSLGSRGEAKKREEGKMQKNTMKRRRIVNQKIRVEPRPAKKGKIGRE